ncbi:hypothetical protein LJC23_07800 [Desulfovibrio sp. OttesenSCG-928-I05]|nr:hypothetical protein [Desulfovibrio sp. OttesenSCG-928-I05]
MNRSGFGRKRTAILVCAAVCVAALGLWLFFSEDAVEGPEEALAAERFASSIALGWGWLHAEDVSVQSMQRATSRAGSNSGRDVAVTFSYTIVVDRDKSELPAAEIDRYYKYLPMCGDAALTPGGRCAMEETMDYTLTTEFGWMPKAFVDFRPELLPFIQRGAVPTR